MKTTQIVVFKLKGHEFGIDIKKVIEILSYQPIRPVPEVPEYVEGLINVRGIIYTVFNLHKRLSMMPMDNEETFKIILLQLEKNKVGLLVESVTEILNIDDNQVEQPSEMLDKKRVNCIEGIVKQEDHMVIVLDVNALISDKDNLFVQGVSDEDNSSSDTK